MQLVKEADTNDQCESSVSPEDFRSGLAGRLIGVTANMEGIYVQTATSEAWDRSLREDSTGDQDPQRTWKQQMGYEAVNVYLVSQLVAEKDSHPELDVVYAPPVGKSLEEATTVVHGDDELTEYIIELARSQGPWKKLTTDGWELLARANTKGIDSICSQGM